jgi:hypothetical protein
MQTLQESEKVYAICVCVAVAAYAQRMMRATAWQRSRGPIFARKKYMSDANHLKLQTILCRLLIAV